MSEELELPKVVEDSSDGQKSGSSKQSNRKPNTEKRRHQEIPEGGIRAAVKAELSEQHPEELQSQERLRG